MISVRKMSSIIPSFLQTEIFVFKGSNLHILSKSGASFALFRHQDGVRDSVTLNCRPASTRLAKSNSVNSCAVFFSRPR
jgi:hypothetical protein